ncbi:MAG: glycosyltransferase [Deltaproteobacteria bacterium]|nr:glycosyltransferase [Deltaproteobacteria bacterium]
MPSTVRLFSGDVEVMLPLLGERRFARLLGSRPLLMFDGLGPYRIPPAWIETIVNHRSAVIGYGVRRHRSAYLRRGLDARHLLYVPPTLAVFPIIFQGFGEPRVAWRPASPQRIFCGGQVLRDFETLRQAANLVRVPVDVVADLSRRPLGRDEFFRPRDRVPFRKFCAMLGASACSVVPLAVRGRTGGQGTLLLSMRLGVPIVATKSPPVSDYVTHGISGLLVPERDAAAMAGAIQTVLSNPGFARNMGAAAAKAYGLFHAEAIRTLNDFFRSVGA